MQGNNRQQQPIQMHVPLIDVKQREAQAGAQRRAFVLQQSADIYKTWIVPGNTQEELQKAAIAALTAAEVILEVQIHYLEAVEVIQKAGEKPIVEAG